MEAITPKLGPVRFCKKLLSPRPSVNKSGAPNFFIQHDKVEDSKLRRYLETFGRAFVRPTGKASNIIT